MCGCGGCLLQLCCCIRDSLLFDMEHHYVLKKYNFDLLTSSLGLASARGGGGCRQIICCIRDSV